MRRSLCHVTSPTALWQWVDCAALSLQCSCADEHSRGTSRSTFEFGQGLLTLAFTVTSIQIMKSCDVRSAADISLHRGSWSLTSLRADVTHAPRVSRKRLSWPATSGIPDSVSMSLVRSSTVINNTVTERR